MKNETRALLKEKVNDLLAAPCACAEAKEAANRWLAAVGTADEDAETARLVAEMKEDVESIDDLLQFASSDLAVKLFGREKAEGFLAHAKELKASGALWCDCPACTAALAIIETAKNL